MIKSFMIHGLCFHKHIVQNLTNLVVVAWRGGQTPICESGQPAKSEEKEMNRFLSRKKDSGYHVRTHYVLKNIINQVTRFCRIRNNNNSSKKRTDLERQVFFALNFLN